ncbi:lipoprotein, LpqJ [Mycolicibacterium rhodesiae JS60]|nr:lipoprotein, LpqJ [Mycolicibacterium rhodesiae JS60]
MRISNGMKAGVAVLWLVAAGAAAAGCSTTTDGAARCPGCGPGGEPSFPTSKPTVSTPTPATPTPTTVPNPGGGQALAPSDSGYVFIETKSGQTRCQLNSQTVGCESDFTNPPVVNGEPANGIEVTASGSVRWIAGNLGDIPTTQLDYATYHAVGWTIDASPDGTQFTNDGTGHGLFISTEGVKVF